MFGGGHVAIIDDFHTVTTCVKGKLRTKKGKMDKGHHAEIEAFAKSLTQGGKGPISWEELRTTTLASLLAVQSLREGAPFDIP